MLDSPPTQEVGMGKQIRVVSSIVLLGGLMAVSAAYPVVGEAAEESMAGGAKCTLSLTKDYTPSPWTNEVGWGNRALAKLGFGVANLFLGWTDLFTEPREEIQAGGSFVKGLGNGLKDGVENTLGGIVHIVTFPITEVDAPLPEGGTQALSSS
jgi:hypothetical protein